MGEYTEKQRAKLHETIMTALLETESEVVRGSYAGISLWNIRRKRRQGKWG